MASTRVFSWKLDDKKYGYLYIPGTNNLITNRITDNDVLQQIADTVAVMNETEYAQAFSNLNGQIYNLYNTSIPGTYSDYIGGRVTNYIVLTGKDGTSYGPEKPFLTEEEMNTVKNTIKSQLAESERDLSGIVSTYQTETIEKIDELTNVTLPQIITDAKEELSGQNIYLASQLSGAAYALSAATQLFDLSSAGIYNDDIISAVSYSLISKNWIDSYSASIDTTITEFNELNSEYTEFKSGEYDVFTSQTMDNFSTISNDITSLDSEVRALSGEIRTVKDSMSITASTESEQQSRMILSDFTMEPVTIYEYTGGTQITGQLNNVYNNPSWNNLDGADLSLYKRVKVYFVPVSHNVGVSNDNITSPITVEIIMDSRGATQTINNYYVGGALTTCVNNDNILFSATVILNKNSNNVWQIAVKTVSLYGTSSTDITTSYIYKIEGWFD